MEETIKQAGSSILDVGIIGAVAIIALAVAAYFFDIIRKLERTHRLEMLQMFDKLSTLAGRSSEAILTVNGTVKNSNELMKRIIGQNDKQDDEYKRHHDEHQMIIHLLQSKK